MINVPPLKVVLIAVIMCFAGGFQVGYTMTIVNPIESIFREFMNDSFTSHYGYPMTSVMYRTLWALLLNSIFIGGLVTGLFLTRFADRLGRKGSFWVGTILFGLGAVASAISKVVNSFELYIIGRFINGFSGILMMALQPIYFTEISEKKYRGFVNGLTGVFSALGNSVGVAFVTPAIFGTVELWPFVHYLQILPTIIMVIALPFMPESPKYLLSKDRRDEAKKASITCYGDQADLEEIFAEIELELSMSGGQLNAVSVLKEEHARKGVVLGCIVNSLVGFSGLVAVSFFGSYFMQLGGLSKAAASYAYFGTTVVSVLASLIGMVLLDKVGRRPLLLMACVLSILVNIVMMVSLLQYQSNGGKWVPFVIIACMGVTWFNAGLGPLQIGAFLPSELVPQNARAASQSAGFIFRYAIAIACTQIFFPLEGFVGPWSFLLFLVPLTITTVWLYYNLPETKMRSITEILEAHKDLPRAPSWQHIMMGCRKISQAPPMLRLTLRSRSVVVPASFDKPHQAAVRSASEAIENHASVMHRLETLEEEANVSERLRCADPPMAEHKISGLILRVTADIEQPLGGRPLRLSIESDCQSSKPSP